MNRLAAGTVVAPSDAGLAAAGDEAAFSRLVDAYHPEMVRVAYVITGEEALAQDAVQAAWLIAWRKLSTLNDPARVRPWLLTIAANEARQIGRKRRRTVVVEIPLDLPGRALSDPANAISRLDLARALDGLSTSDRTLIALRYLAGFDAADIARMTGRSVSGTRGHLSRLMTRLRGELGDA